MDSIQTAHFPLDESLAYVKLDGDSVGALFQSRPSLLRPALSVAVETMIRDAWLGAMEELMRREKIDFLPVAAAKK